ncbi:MAG TPA: VCBS repeat-containing protein, partial [Planctomycetaceae bacterium]|nr:VCBS repeat-containing protein [Planctomycetaceae bacterium]
RAEFLPVGYYNAWVRGYDAANRPLGWNETLPFQIKGDSYQPKFVTPPQGLQANGIAPLLWNPVGWADTYEVTIHTTAGTVISRERTRSNRYTIPYLAVGNYQAVLKTLDSGSGVQSVTSPVFQVDSNTYKSLIPLTTPIVVDNIGDGKKLFWPAVRGAVSYDIWVDRIETTGIASVSQMVREFTFAESFPLDNRFSDGATYKAWIRPRFADGSLGPWGIGNQFTLAREMKISRDPASDIQQPRFEWTEYPNAISYRFQVIKKSVSQTVNAFPPVIGLKRAWYNVQQPLPAATYYAWLEVTFPGNQVITTQSSDFVVPTATATTASTGIKVVRQTDGMAVQWSNAQNGIYDIRVSSINWSGATDEVIREQSSFATGSAAAKSHLIRGGVAPGLYRADVGISPTAGGSPLWTQGPVFYFDGSSLNPLLTSNTTPTLQTPNLTGPFVGDFNGDGVQDLVKRTTADGALTMLVNKSTSLSLSSDPDAIWNSNGSDGYTDFVSTTANSSILVGDFNGDGRDDLLQPNPATGVWSVMRSMPSGAFEKVDEAVTQLLNPDLPNLSWDATEKSLSWTKLSSPNETGIRTFEFQVVQNGTTSTYAQLAYSFSQAQDSNAATTTMSRSLSTTLANGEYTIFCRTVLNGRISQWSDGFGINVGSTVSPWQNYMVGDFNGDRRDDVAAFNVVRQQWTVFVSTGTSFERSSWTESNVPAIPTDPTDVYSRHTVMDVNGDGRKDIVAKNNSTNQWIAYLSTGTSFLTQVWASPSFLRQSGVSSTPMAGDMDGDGSEDLVVWTGSSLQVAFSRSGVFSDSANGNAWDAVSGMPGNTIAVDMNNDGRADLIGFDAAGKTIVALSSIQKSSTIIGFGTPTVWEVNSTTPWVIKLQDSGVIVA